MLTQRQKTVILSLHRSGHNVTNIIKVTELNRATVDKILSSRRRVVVLSDPHCGHIAGLTPPDWWDLPHTVKFRAQMEEIWIWYGWLMEVLKPDTVFCIGDMLDGMGKKSGGTEQITLEWLAQVNMAYEVVRATGAKICQMVYGTGYHTGQENDYEDILCAKLNDNGIKSCISGHGFPKVHNIQFDIKHKIGASSVPHGRSTALMKSKLWNSLWAERGQQPTADVLLRGHAHYFDYVGNQQYLAVICPALSGWGSKYGVRQCEGIVDTGLIWFDIYDGDTLETLDFRYDIPNLSTQKVVPEVI